jgi:hypothetical protein
MAIGTRAEVLHGKATETSGGLTKKDLKVSKKTGEIVSKDKSKQGKKNDWATATKKAYAELQKTGVITKADGLVKFNIGPKGKALYDLTLQYHNQ